MLARTVTCTVLILLATHVSKSSIEDEEDDEFGAFVATSEWQVIREGQSIPPGLHVRINLETGLKEAKLMEDGQEGATLPASVEGESVFGDPRRPHYYGQSDRRGIINKSKKMFSREELAAMLKHSSDDGQDKVHYLEDLSSEDKSASPSSAHLRLKDDLQDMVTVTTEVQTMLSHLQVLLDGVSSSEDTIQALEEIEFYVHQIDNARDFDTLGGLAVIVRMLNSSDVDVVVASLLVLGACVQGNPPVQQAAMSYGVLSPLLPLLSPSRPRLLQRRALYALGALLRGQPMAVDDFIISSDGLEILSEGAGERDDAVLAKIVILLIDILMIEEPLELTKSEIHDKLVGGGWCSHAPKLLYCSDVGVAVDGIILMHQLMDKCVYSDHQAVMNDMVSQLVNNEDYVEAYSHLIQILHRTRNADREL